MTERPRDRPGSKRWILLAALGLLTAAALLRGPSARLFGGADGAERAVTGVGQRRSVELGDGSRADLSVLTTLVYPDELPRDRRVVTLTGEALFTVAVDSARPFVVNGGQLRIETAGATFAVRAYSAERTARVVVGEGSVRVRPLAGADTVGRVVRSGQLVRVDRQGRFAREEPASIDRFTAWRAGRIIFAGTPLREALVELGRWQDVELRIADSVVANRRVTAEFSNLQTFTEILDEIALAIGAVYRWQGRVVTFRRER